MAMSSEDTKEKVQLEEEASWAKAVQQACK